MEVMESYETMKPIRKRIRSDESPCSQIQSKIFINQRIIEQNDENKMRQIQAKTMRYLFEGARKSFMSDNATTELWQQIKLHGDGRIDFRNNAVPYELPADRRKSDCCSSLKTFVQEKCSMCNFKLCEECGYSCEDCGRFLCSRCGSVENPICEACRPFNTL